MKSIVEKIWNSLWAFSIPIITAAIISPFSNIFNYEGLIIKNPILKDSTIIYSLSNNYSSGIERFRIDYKTNEPNKFTVGQVILDQVPNNKYFVSEMTTVKVPKNSGDYQFLFDSLPKGIYNLYIPLHGFIEHRIPAEDLGILHLFKEDENMIPSEIHNTRPYRFYDYRYFHPFLFSVILLFILFIITLSLKFSTQKNKS